MPSDYGKHAYVDPVTGVQLSAQERIDHSVAVPESPLALTPRQLTKVAKARAELAMAELLNDQMPQMTSALAQLREQSPKAYLDQMVELAKFVTPQKKAVEVEADNLAGDARSMTLDQLLNVVSVQ